jgi:thiol-disulfide isomerase/thioredoxin
MRKVLFIALASVLLAACGGKDSYRIKGTVDGIGDSTLLTLCLIDYDGLTPLDSFVVKNGKFSFKGQIDGAQMAVVMYETEESLNGCQFFLEPGNISIKMNAETGEQHLSGTPNNEVFQQFYDDTEAFNDEAFELSDKIRITVASQGDASDLYEQMGDLQDRFKAVMAKSILDNADMAYAYHQLMDNYTLFEPDEVMEMLEALAPTFGQDLAFNQLTASINSQLVTSLGHPFIDFETKILDKKYKFEGSAKLSDYIGKNKVVLLDFWASWCAPCMNEVPNLKAAYNKFKSKGFEIVSVSVDDETDAWIKAVKDNGMNWVQLWNGVEDLENSAAFKYSITAIPTTFLIDADGTIIGRNLRDGELADALEDYFKN